MLGELNHLSHSSPMVRKFMKTAKTKYAILVYFCLGLPKPAFLSGDTSSWKLVIDYHVPFLKDVGLCWQRPGWPS